MTASTRQELRFRIGLGLSSYAVDILDRVNYALPMINGLIDVIASGSFT